MCMHYDSIWFIFLSVEVLEEAFAVLGCSRLIHSYSEHAHFEVFMYQNNLTFFNGRFQYGKQLLSQVSYDKLPENRIVSISRNMSHTCFRRLAAA